jgi:very-short-patch-repair endonuclease
MPIIPYNRNFKKRASDLRKQGTLGEALLWNELKQSKMFGYKFMRQKPIDNYIVDFFCKKLMLAIEIDGNSHDTKMDLDKYRQERLEIMGIRFLRFTEQEVRKNMDAVIREIKKRVESRS